MKKLIVILCLVSLPAWATDIRLICNNGQAVREHRPDQVYTNENLPEGYEGKRWKIYAKENLPKYEWLEQVKCSGDTFTVDASVKPDYVVKQEAVDAKAAELDEALAEPTIDSVQVIKLNRELEKLKANK
jgi:hypothetical protein